MVLGGCDHFKAKGVGWKTALQLIVDSRRRGNERDTSTKVVSVFHADLGLHIVS